MDDYTPTLVPIPADTRFPKLRIDCYGPTSVVYVKGVAIGRGVDAVEFKHDAKKRAKLMLTCDVENMAFLQDIKNYSGPDSNKPKPE